MNEGTFERRIHQGVDKARNREEQGELYGVQNLFRFDPMGTVSKNVRLGNQDEQADGTSWIGYDLQKTVSFRT